jgi:hypothetical protein
VKHRTPQIWRHVFSNANNEEKLNVPCHELEINGGFGQGEDLIDRLIPGIEFLDSLRDLSVHGVHEQVQGLSFHKIECITSEGKLNNQD